MSIQSYQAIVAPRAVVTDYFRGSALSTATWSVLAGTDPQAVHGYVTATDQRFYRLTSGDVGGSDPLVDAIQISGGVAHRADRAGINVEFDLRFSNATGFTAFWGLTDQSTVLEMPFTLTTVTYTSNATDAVGILFDINATVDTKRLVGVKADVDAAHQDTAVAMTTSTWEKWGIEVNKAGAAKFFRNGAEVGTILDAAVSTTKLLCPVVAIMSRGVAARSVDIGRIHVESGIVAAG